MVRMKRSYERPAVSAMPRNCAAISSTSAFGVVPLAVRRLLDLQAVLVRAGHEEHVIAVDALEPRDRVGGDDLIGVADMRRAVRIRDGRRDVEFLFRRPWQPWRVLQIEQRPSRRSPNRIGKIVEQCQNERPAVEIVDVDLARLPGDLLTYLHRGARRAAPSAAHRGRRRADSQRSTVSRASS